MRPLRPEERRRIMEQFSEDSHAEVEAEIQEYQELLSKRLREDPNRAAAAKTLDRRGSHDERIRELRAKLFTFEDR